jgi:hypothetical protein
MDKAPSFEDMKEEPLIHLSFSATKMIVRDGGGKHALEKTSELYFELKVVEGQNDAFPLKKARVRVIETNQIDETEKYPYGFVQFHEASFGELASAEFVIYCRSEAVTRMCSLVGSAVSFYITMPKIPEEIPRVYPIEDHIFWAEHECAE